MYLVKGTATFLEAVMFGLSRDRTELAAHSFSS